MSLAVLADHMASKGRGGDSMLIHMSPREVQGLQALAENHGGSLTINPDTGLPEANFLEKILPTILGAGLSLIPGVGPMMAAGIVGGIQTVRTGDIGKGLAAGLGAYGGANLTSGLMEAGTSTIGAAEAAKGLTMTPELAAELQIAGEGAKDTLLQQQVADRMAAATPYEKLSSGVDAFKNNPMGMTKSLAMPAFMAAGPILADQAVTEKGPQTVTKRGMIRPSSYDPYSGIFTAGTPYEATPTKMAAGGGLMSMDNGGYDPGKLNFSGGGESVIRMNTGGFTDDQVFDWFAANAGASDADIASAMNTFGVGTEQVARATGTMDQLDDYNQRFAAQSPSSTGGGTFEYNGDTFYSGSGTPTGGGGGMNLTGIGGLDLTGGTGGGIDLTGGGGSDVTTYVDDGYYGDYVDGGNDTQATAPEPEPVITPIKGLAALDSATGTGTTGTTGALGETKGLAALGTATNAGTTTGTASALDLATGKPMVETITKMAEPAKPIAYSDRDIAEYLIKNPDVNIEAAIKATNADPAKVYGYIASLANPFVGSTDTKGGSGTLGIYNQMKAQGIDPTEAYNALLKNDPNYKGWSLADIQRGYDLDKGAYALAAQIEKDKIAADPKLGYDRLWVKFMDDNKYSINDAAQAFGLSKNEVKARYDAVKDADKKPPPLPPPPPPPPPVVTPSVVPGSTKLDTATTLTNGSFGNYGSGNKTGVDSKGNVVSIATPGDVITNTDGSRTIVPNIPGRDTGFTGIGAVRSAWEAGGGSTGYTSPTYTKAQFKELYEDKLTGGSKQSYDYLRGTTPYDPTPYTPTGELMKPYWESVGGMPENRKAKRYIYEPGSGGKRGRYVENPDYVKPKYVRDGERAAALADESKEPTESPGAGKKWTWNSTDKKWEAKPIDGASGNVTAPVEVARAGGLMAMAGGGMAGQFNLGGYSDGGRLLRGPGDGVSDSIPATIGNKRPARLADGEFVVPARIVSELGNGSTEAGARKLYAMMDRVQSARRRSIGKGKVAKNSRADKYLPA
jgi:hypothetical protein